MARADEPPLEEEAEDAPGAPPGTSGPGIPARKGGARKGRLMREQVFDFSTQTTHFSHMSHTPFPHISEINSFFGAESLISPPRHTISPIRRTPLFPISQKLIPFLEQSLLFLHPDTPFLPYVAHPFFPVSLSFFGAVRYFISPPRQPISPICRTPLFAHISEYHSFFKRRLRDEI